MDEATQGRAQWLADFLERQPLAGFLALTILALLFVAGLFLLEKRAHQKTLREMLPLLTTFSGQWNRHLELQERMADRLDLKLAPQKSVPNPEDPQ